MTQFGSQIQTAVHVRLATAAALDTCTYSDTTAQIPANQDLGAKLVATSNGALTIDSVAAAVDDEILVKDQVATLQNGVYRVRNIGSTTTKWSLERSRQARDSGQFSGMVVTTGPDGGSFDSYIFLYSGADNPTLGMTAITFAALASAGTTAVTQPQGTDNTTIATTAFVHQELATSPSVLTVSSGDTTTLAQSQVPVATAIINSSGTLVTYTLALEDGFYQGAIWEILFTKAVTTLTWGGTNYAAEGLTKPSAITIKAKLTFVWDDAGGGGALGWALIGNSLQT